MKKINLILLLTLVSTFGFAGIITKTYNIGAPEIIYHGEYQSVAFDGAMLTGIAGQPSLPYFSVSLLLPPGEVATSIQFIGHDEVIVEGDFKIFPYQNSKPLSDPTKSEFQVNHNIYESTLAYPKSALGRLSTNYLNGYSIALSTFTPVIYYPAQQKLSYYSKITIVIKTAANGKSVQTLSKLTSSLIAKRNLLNFIQNPEATYAYNSFRTKSENNYSLLIITPDQFVDGFDGLRNIYLSRGIKSNVFTTEYIGANISGQDLQEKIRNLIIQEYEECDIEFVILGGDVEHIPYRGFSCFVQSGGGYTSDDIPADLYYSALDGTWDDNVNGIWGEIDEDDLLPEVAVARYPFSNASELAKIIHKSINYQNNPVLGELVTPLLAGEHLYSDPETWGRDYLDLLIGERDDNGYTTNGIPGTYQIDSLYEHDGSWNGSDLMNEINAGKQFVHHVGHASPSFVAHLYSSDITNSNFYGANGIDHNYTLLQTHGCDCGSFDNNDCILEKMVTIDNFAVSVIGNSRFGWFNEGQSEGPAAHLHREMVDAMYNEELYHLGMAFVESKIQTAPWVEAPGQWEEGALRWNFYDINILGDPVLSVWTNEPVDIDVDYVETLTIGTVSTTVNVSSSGLPMENFTCTIIKEGLLHATGVTDGNGNVTLVFDPVVEEIGDASLIVVGQNCLPDTNIISFVPSEGAYVIYNSHEVHDPSGNNNGMPDFGESILLTVGVNNLGVQDASNVVSTLTVDDDYITISDDNEIYGFVAAGATVIKEDAFLFDIADNIPDQHVVIFTLICESEGDVWESEFEIVINAPLPQIGEMVINDDATGNGNGQLDPGETATVIISASNAGNCDCLFADMGLETTNSYISITPNNVNIDGLLVGETKYAEFNVVVDASTPIGTLIDFECELTLCDYSDNITFYNNVGLLIEDFESGDFTMFEWHMGGNAGWNIVDDEFFNGQYSARSGSIGDYATSELYITLDVVSDDEVSFARKVSSEANYDFLRFYIDGFLIDEWSGEETWEIMTIDISSGSHTLLWSYEKDANTVSGSDCAWVDDVVFPASTTVISVEEIANNSDFNIFPNPGSGLYTIIINTNSEINEINIYNTLGSLVTKLSPNFVSNKTTVNLSNLVPGIYFVEVNTASGKMIKKIVQK